MCLSKRHVHVNLVLVVAKNNLILRQSRNLGALMIEPA